MENPGNENIDVRRFRISLIFPTIFIILLWLVKAIELGDSLDLYYYGVFPRKLSGLIGILTSPLIHANFDHLINNSVPLFCLSLALFFFYSRVALKVYFFSYFLTGICVWLFARPSYHIGASGLIYAFASFLFFGGIVRQNINLLAISLLVAFLYGSMVWGIFPYKPDMSFESHLMGLMIGLVMAIIYRKEGPAIPPPRLIEDEAEEEDELEGSRADADAQVEEKKKEEEM